MLTGRTDPHAEAPVLWPSHEKRRLAGKDPDVGSEGKRRRGQQRTRWLDRVTEVTNMNLTQLREAVEDRRAWACSGPWDHEESDTT